jgi:hypothetical protein
MRAFLCCSLAVLACQKPVEDDVATVVVHTSPATKCVRLTLNDGATKTANPAGVASDVTFVVRLEARDAKTTTAVAAGFGDVACNAVSLAAERDQGTLVFGGRLDLYLAEPLNGGTGPDGGNTMANGDTDAGAVDNQRPDAGRVDSGVPDSGEPQVPDAGEPPALLNFNSNVLTSIAPGSALVFDQNCMGSFDTSPRPFPGNQCGAFKAGKKVTMLNGKEALVFAAANITVGSAAKLQFYGPLPVAFIATNAIVINSKIELKGTGQEPGAGARTTCSAGDGAGKKNGSYGGGAGGSYGGTGGKGGDGAPSVNEQMNGEGGTPSGPSGSENGTPLEGGCEGGQSGDKTKGGTGGGAIQLYAGQSIAFDGGGAINAPGRGGGAGDKKESTGGGGGGSGGHIVIQSRTVSFGAVSKLTANGGSGGSGSIGNDYLGGANGAEGSDDADGVLGGLSAGMGGAGGSGAPRSDVSRDGADGIANALGFTVYLGNGGGGGGSVGRIFIQASTVTCVSSSKALVSPAPAGLSTADAAKCIK